MEANFSEDKVSILLVVIYILCLCYEDLFINCEIQKYNLKLKFFRIHYMVTVEF